MAALNALAALLRAEGGLVGQAVVEPQDGAAAFSAARAAARGPRARGHEGEYELLVEAVYEGYLLHYGHGRVVRTLDQDLGLLAGDQLYALGLARLVELGDIESVGELADIIALTARAHALGDLELADAVWAAGAHALGWGSTPTHARAKAQARAGAPAAAAGLRACVPDPT